VPGDEVSDTEPPVQKLTVPPGLMVATGSALTVIVVAEDVAEHPLLLVTLTV
jgi:hypothetical protein